MDDRELKKTSPSANAFRQFAFELFSLEPEDCSKKILQTDISADLEQNIQNACAFMQAGAQIISICYKWPGSEEVQSVDIDPQAPEILQKTQEHVNFLVKQYIPYLHDNTDPYMIGRTGMIAGYFLGVGLAAFLEGADMLSRTDTFRTQSLELMKMAHQETSGVPYVGLEHALHESASIFDIYKIAG